MHDDEAVWSAIGGHKKFCSFKMETETELLCRNANNVTGLCTRASCPLANSKYATVREVKDKLYLCLKEPERAHMPSLLYEKIELSEDYDAAIEQIDREMKGFSPFLVHKCKQRLTKLSDYLERKELLTELGKPVYIKRRRKAEKQDRAREKKAAKAAKIEEKIEQEILERYKTGVYGDKAVMEQEKKTKSEEKRERLGQKQTGTVKYVAEFEEEEEEEKSKKSKKKITMEW